MKYRIIEVKHCGKTHYMVQYRECFIWWYLKGGSSGSIYRPLTFVNFSMAKQAIEYDKANRKRPTKKIVFVS